MADGSVRRNRPARSERRCSAGARASSSQEPRLEPEGAQERALRHRPVDRGAGGARRLGERREIDMASKDRPSPGQASGAQAAWPRTACSVSPGGPRPGAVVDEQRDAARRGKPLADRVREGRCAPG